MNKDVKGKWSTPVGLTVKEAKAFRVKARAEARKRGEEGLIQQYRSNAQTGDIREAILDIVNNGDGMTVRHLFYRLVSAGIVEKTEVAYGVVGKLTLTLRRSGKIPPGKIVDGTRTYTTPTTYNSVGQALKDLASSYRCSYWDEAEHHVEVWSEKDAIRSIVGDVTWEFAVPLMITRGFASESVVEELAEETKHRDKPCIILGLNDYDPSGQLMLPDILKRVQLYAPHTKFTPVQVAVTRQQVDKYKLPTRPTKTAGNSHAANFKDDRSVELDAMNPDILRKLLRTAIEKYIDPRKWAAMQATEESERTFLRTIVNKHKHRG